ncbi:aminotransferase class V-fold PLP-dependent enzyme [Pumilibacter muris]|uniref:aminotransferase class V-fold PLP-dependent enzyme n=1 Tax=Pumilibacter muris TaxID=2941510 RepID=UPI00203DBCFC|nr:aminotransferase class V-fold PLP-dependent enzyme [Pumilibacter muris]
MIYFDNSATSGVKPESVINAAVSAMKFMSANPGRSGHSLSLKAGMLVYSTRKKAAKLLGLSEPERIVFSLNCTQALNTAILGTVQDGGNVVTTVTEHNSVLRPLFELQRAGKITVSLAEPNEHGVITANAIERALTPRTYMVAVNHVSNVTGATNSIDEIGKLCRKRGIKFLVDGAQSVGYGEINISEQNIDYLAVAPHKGLHAIQGIGILALGADAPKPIIYGGTGTQSENVLQPSELPESLESGTLPTPAIAALNAAITHNEKTRAQSREKIHELSAYILETLQTIRGVKIYTPQNVFNGMISFNIRGIGSMDASNILSSQYDIAVRGGLHCAPLMHRHLGTVETGIIRASISGDNTFGEAEFFLKAVKEIAETEYKGNI